MHSKPWQTLVQMDDAYVCVPIIWRSLLHCNASGPTMSSSCSALSVVTGNSTLNVLFVDLPLLFNTPLHPRHRACCPVVSVKTKPSINHKGRIDPSRLVQSFTPSQRSSWFEPQCLQFTCPWAKCPQPLPACMTAWMARIKYKFTLPLFG